MTNATTGSERIVPGQEPPVGEQGEQKGRSPLLARLISPAARNWQFSLVILAAIVMRVIVIIGYPPILWFNDSYNYLYDAVTHIPDAVRPNGYPFLLSLLLPLHSDYPIGLLQAAMGLAVGIGIYAVLRRRGLPWWGAALPALPVLFDSYELHLEHQVTADTPFIFLVTITLIILCWNDRPSVPAMAVAGLLIGYATLVRSVGEPLLIVVALAMLARRAGWRRLAALVVAGIMPVGAYMIWFHHSHGKFALTESSGAFLYSRVSTFAECKRMDVPADLTFLCDPVKPRYRPVAGEYIWADYELWPYQHTLTPLNAALGTNNSRRFTAALNPKTQTFAERAIEGQPVSYLRVVTKDILHTFGWNRQPDPDNYYGNGPVFQFVSGPVMTAQIPWYASQDWGRGGKYQDHQSHVMYTAEQAFAGAGNGLGATRAVSPWAGALQGYQRVMYLRGPLLGIIVLIGAVGVAARWRRWGGIGLLPWLTGALLIALPPLTAGFSYRYVLAAVPAACLAAGLAFAGAAGGRPVSVRALAADLPRHLGRGVAVDQE